jgi:hypothetical protein
VATVKGRRYKDEFVAAGTDLCAALEVGDTKKAETLYQESQKELFKYWPEDKRHLLNWKIGGTLMKEKE